MTFLDKFCFGLLGVSVFTIVYDDIAQELDGLFEANAAVKQTSYKDYLKDDIYLCDDNGCVDLLEKAFNSLDEKPQMPLGKVPSQKQIKCLAQNIYQEAGIEPLQGKIAVAYGTIERVKDNRFPDSLCGVVWQKNQMSWTKSYKKRNKPTPPIYYTIALDVLKGNYSPPSKCPATNWYNPIDARGSFNEMQFVKGKTICTYTISRHTYIAFK